MYLVTLLSKPIFPKDVIMIEFNKPELHVQVLTVSIVVNGEKFKIPTITLTSIRPSPMSDSGTLTTTFGN